MKRQPAWLTMLLVALYEDDQEQQFLKRHLLEHGPPVDDHLRLRMKSLIRGALMGEQADAGIPDNGLHALADQQWNPSPVLASFNDLCTARRWQPEWHIDAHHVKVADRVYRLPQETIENVMKKKQKKARLAAMVLLDFNKTPKKEWLSL